MDHKPTSTTMFFVTYAPCGRPGVYSCTEYLLSWQAAVDRAYALLGEVAQGHQITVHAYGRTVAMLEGMA